MANIVMARSSVDVQVPAGESITVFSQDTARIYQRVGEAKNSLGTVASTQQAFGPFASGATVVIDTGEYSAIYGVGASPVIRELLSHKIQRAPAAINAGGAIPLAALFGGVINANAGLLGVTGTLPAGATIDSAGDFRVDDAFDWSIISTGLGAFTVGASAGHTVVGSASVGSAQSGVFRTRKTGTNAFVTYRIG